MVRKRSWPAVSHYGLALLLAPRSCSRAASGREWGRQAYDLQLHSLAVEFDGSDLLCGVSAAAGFTRERVRSPYEVDTDCGDVGLSVGVVGESEEQARLSNTGVTDEEQLEEVVVSVGEVRTLFLDCASRAGLSKWVDRRARNMEAL